MRVTVLTPTVTGREELLRRAQYSVRWQTWNGPLDHVTVLDAPSPAEGFQRCLDQARGELIIPLSDDDWLAPHAIDTLASLIMDGGVDFASGRTLIQNGHDKNDIYEPPTVVGEPLSLKRLEQQGFVFGGAHLTRRDLVQHLGGFNTDYPNAADYDLYWKIAEAQPKVGFTPEILYFYTDHPDTDANTNSDLIAEQCVRIRKAHQ
jgi:hypothetical protein